MTSILETVSQPTRRDIIAQLWHHELAAGEIHQRLGTVTFGAVSQHLRVLLEAGLVEVRQEHRQRHYRINRDGFGPLAAYFDSFWGNALDRLAAVSEAAQAQANVRKKPSAKPSQKATPKPSSKAKPKPQRTTPSRRKPRA